MTFSIYRDLSSIAFIRCTSKIEGTSNLAEGTGFSIKSALEKCFSEKIERSFQVQNQIKALGIAAHKNPVLSEAHALYETLETLMLKKIVANRAVHGFSILKTKNIKIYCSKVNKFWFSFIIGKHNGSLVYTYATRSTLIKSVLQSWSEYRNIKFYNITPADQLTYTKANKFFQNFEPQLIHSFKTQQINISQLKKFVHKEQQHFITYFTQGEPV